MERATREGVKMLLMFSTIKDQSFAPQDNTQYQVVCDQPSFTQRRGVDTPWW